MRISAPTYTMTPNDLFDHWLPNLGEGELKVLLVIMRKTFGWHKPRDRISISQLSQITGLREETVVIATKSLQNKGIILREVVGKIGKQETYYELIINEDSNNSYPSEQRRTPLGLTPLGSTEAQKKTPSYKETNTKQQQPVAAVEEKKSESREDDVQYENSKGEKLSVSQSEIFRHFVKLPYSTEIIKKAISSMQSTTKIVNNPLKLLESICKTMHENSKPDIKPTEKKEVKKIAIKDANHITWAEYEKQQKLKDERDKNV